MNAIAPTSKPADYIQLVDSIGKVFIIAYKEPTGLLEEILSKEKFQYEILRQEHKPEYQTYSRSYLCLMNHYRAWEKAVQESKPTLIIEADFVPVVNFGKLPLPFHPHQKDWEFPGFILVLPKFIVFPKQDMQKDFLLQWWHILSISSQPSI